MSEWTENFENDIKTQIEGIKRLDAGFINVRLLNNSAKKLDEFSGVCSNCKQLKKDYEAILPEVVKRVEEPEFRDNYEKKLIEVSKHLEKQHGIMPKKYYASLYTLIGIGVGLASGYLLTYLIREDLVYTGLFYGGIGGVLFGYFLGFKKDKKLSALGKSI